MKAVRTWIATDRRVAVVTNEGFTVSEEAIVFEPFRLFPSRQLLLEADKPVRLGSRALELLIALARRPGDVVCKDELIAQIWPGVFVGEGNLRVHIAALRRALGDGHAGRRFIVTVQGKGYSFVGPLVHSNEEEIAQHVIAEAGLDHFPTPLRRVIGRRSVCDALIEEISRRRFVTIVGPGGVGKTTVALTVAAALSASYRDGVRFVDLATVVTPGLVQSALASAIDVPVSTDSPVPAILSALCDKEMLVVLDSCEHVLDAAASLCEAIFNGARRVHVLATSREALRVEGERIHRLDPLEVPAESEGLGATKALSYPAIQLFAERAVESVHDFKLADSEASVAANICKRLDGLPLAIELAASRVEAFGIHGLAALLDDQLQLLQHGHRRSLPRHQTISAALDWSYNLLPEAERVVLRRLAVLSGAFTFECAAAVIADDEIRRSRIADDIANLVSASLVVVDITREVASYRLLDSTRAYAREKLMSSDEYHRVSRRHAEYFRIFFQEIEPGLVGSPAGDAIAAQRHQIDDLRSALDWSFSPDGDAALGIALTAAGIPMWLSLSLVEECRVRVEQALTTIATGGKSDPRSIMQLHTALGMCLFTRGPGPESNAAFSKALEVAESIGSAEYRLRALWGLWFGRSQNGEHAPALKIAEQITEVASVNGDQVSQALADRALGITYHFMGDQIKACQFLQRMIDRQVGDVRKSLIIRYHFDPLISGRMRYAWVLWQLGYPEKANQIVTANRDEVFSIDHAISACTAIGLGACPVALACGHFDTASDYITYMIDQASKHRLTTWQAWGRCLHGALLIRQGHTAAGLEILQPTLGRLSERKYPLWSAMFQPDLASAMAATGKGAQALAVIGEALAGAEFRQEGWQLPELLRVKGEILRQQDVDAAEVCFRSSLDLARRQQAQSWELRAAMGLARLCVEQGRGTVACSVLEEVYNRFTEGFDTVDLVAARAFLDQVR
jgi:predicted ATPase/DNA-binding winged helix-turn-helix (wHTH) protein